MFVHPWHGIEPGNLAPELVDCIVEIPRGSHQKYELDKKSGLLRLDRVLYSAVFYPANYGFIPRTYCDDRDPLDILVLGQHEVVPLCIVTARPIGVMQMVDQDEEDDKIIAVHEHDPAFSHYRDISELPQHTLYELQNFFEDYKKLEHKKVRIERRMGREHAHRIIMKSLELYVQSFTDEGTKRPDAPILASEQREHDRETGNAVATDGMATAGGLTTSGGSVRAVAESVRRTPSASARAEAARRQAQRLKASDDAARAATENSEG
jgi:inorganic pyrophosphatase